MTPERKEQEIICPRHVSFKIESKLHIQHCLSCQTRLSPNGKNLLKTFYEYFLEKVINCSQCFISQHFDCYKKLNDQNEIDSTGNSLCIWCHDFDFTRYGEVCYKTY